MPLTHAAQAVQLSAYPDAYPKWTNEAIALVDQYGTGEIALDCSKTPFGNAEPAPRNPDGSWPDKTCSIQPDPDHRHRLHNPAHAPSCPAGHRRRLAAAGLLSSR
jgi:hypothetical protein